MGNLTKDDHPPAQEDSDQSFPCQFLDLIIATQARLLQAHFDLTAFMNLVVEQMHILTAATGVVIELVEKDEMVYRATTGSIKNYIGLRLPVLNSISGLCITSQTILRSDDTEIDPRVNKVACQKVGARSLIVSPLFYEGKAIGVLKTISDKPAAFTKNDMQTLQLMSGLIASGIAHNIFISESKKVKNLQNEFISMVSHELRTPLTSIRGALKLLLSGALGDFSTDGKKLLEIANNNSERLIRLVSEILDIEKMSAGKMSFNIQPLSLKNLVNDAVKNNQMYAKQLNVNLALDPIDIEEVMIKIDADRFLQIMANLISNAIKYSPKNESVRVNVIRNDKAVRISIIDRGPGIPDEFQTRLFEKFAQANIDASHKQGGTGLGLSITKMLIEKFGGLINFETSKAGTTFYFDLPIYQEAPQVQI